MDGIIPQINARREKEWLSRKEASFFLGSLGCHVSAVRLAQLAVHNNSGKGPPFYRVRGSSPVRGGGTGGHAVYHRDDLKKWAETQKVRVE